MSPRIDNLDNKFIKIVPGPGAYTPGTKKNSNYAYSFGLKPDTDFHHKYHSSIPGPGTYDDKARQTLSKMGASLDRSNRQGSMNKTQAIIPGPGRYQPSTTDLMRSNYAPKYGFGSGGRPDLATGAPTNIATSKRSLSDSKSTQSQSPSRLLVPGPGAYNIKQVVGNEGPKRSLAGRFKIDLAAKELNYKPGPNLYTPSTTFSAKTSPNYRIGSSLREKYYLADKYKHELPPPNIYNPDFQKTRSKAPATGFGYGERSSLSKTFLAPGPGQYRTPSKIGEGPRYHLGAKLFDSFEAKKMKELPAPNIYTPKFEVLAKTQSVFSIGKAKRDEYQSPSKVNVPGPGAYPGKAAVTQRDAPKWGFGSSERPVMGNTKVKVPGPGSYKLKSTFADVPSYLIPNQKTEYV